MRPDELGFITKFFSFRFSLWLYLKLSDWSLGVLWQQPIALPIDNLYF
jgi:hypothetical protein